MSRRACEYPDCDVEDDMDRMILLFRECWYCQDHALTELGLTLSERDLTDEEARILVALQNRGDAQ